MQPVRLRRHTSSFQCLGGQFVAQEAFSKVRGSALASYSAGISACEEGDQWPWQWPFALLGGIREMKMRPDVFFSYSAGISACEKGEQRQRALTMLSEIWEANLGPDTIRPPSSSSSCPLVPAPPSACPREWLGGDYKQPQAPIIARPILTEIPRHRGQEP
ncbi:unnamed protein product [Prorocentrum cordatum]|uniref:Uncharacterized protein n=1 Tax=Prorocentrum cordatum TaxID=2364126 RepID=A0ABN9UD58_9DINO|nr:unnamed protein product [Polarella glacialis]